MQALTKIDAYLLKTVTMLKTHISDPRLPGMHVAVYVLRLHGGSWSLLRHEPDSGCLERVRKTSNNDKMQS